MAIGDYRELPAHSVKHFQSVMRYLVSRCGGVNAAIQEAGISDHAYRRLMKDDAVVKSVGQKILSAYSRVTHRVAA